MIETFSQMHLLIAALLVAASGLLSVGIATTIFLLYERLELKFARRKAAAQPESSEKPKAVHF
jgi:hypothetical protein